MVLLDATIRRNTLSSIMVRLDRTICPTTPGRGSLATPMVRPNRAMTKSACSVRGNHD
jgi:hypothetical protein